MILQVEGIQFIYADVWPLYIVYLGIMRCQIGIY